VAATRWSSATARSSDTTKYLFTSVDAALPGGIDASGPVPRWAVTDHEQLTGAELEAQEGEALPDREAMPTVKVGIGTGIDNFAMPINEAIAIKRRVDRVTPSGPAGEPWGVTTAQW